MLRKPTLRIAKPLPPIFRKIRNQTNYMKFYVLSGFYKMLPMNSKNGFYFFLLIAALLLLLSSCGKYLEGTGYVYAEETRLPIKNVLVKAYIDHPSPDAFQMQTHTDTTGGYYVRTSKVGCGFFCPDVVVQLIMEGYQSEIVKNPSGDTVFMKKEQ